MDLRFSPQDEAFYMEVREFFEKEASQELADELNEGMGPGPFGWEFQRKLGKRGWLASMLPRELGGINGTHMQQHILMQEIDYFAPLMVGSMVGAQIMIPMLMRFGTAEQKQTYVTRIAEGEIEFALGYTEPQAGSDLAAINIRAQEDIDCYILNGDKCFNTGCHFSHYHILCARTEDTVPKHRGLSLFIVPLDSTGIEISPMWTSSGERTNQVFYDNVRVPKKNLVGEKNRGFYHMAAALEQERIFPTGALQRALDDITVYCMTSTQEAEKLIDKPLVKQRLGEMATAVAIAHCLGYRIAWCLDNGQVAAHEASALKVFVTELHQRLAYTGLQIMGSHGQLMPGSKYVPLDGWLVKWFLAGARRTIVGGTSEILRTVIAQRGLGLPRG